MNHKYGFQKAQPAFFFAGSGVTGMEHEYDKSNIVGQGCKDLC